MSGGLQHKCLTDSLEYPYHWLVVSRISTIDMGMLIATGMNIYFVRSWLNRRICAGSNFDGVDVYTTAFVHILPWIDWTMTMTVMNLFSAILQSLYYLHCFTICPVTSHCKGFSKPLQYASTVQNDRANVFQTGFVWVGWYLLLR